MFPTKRANARALVLAAVVGLAGCASEGGEGLFSTGALGTQSAGGDLDPQCTSLATRIDGLRREGVADKIEKAAAKKYKMTQADLTKADQLTKANADFQLRCSPIMPDPVAASPASPPPPASKAKAPKSVSSLKQQPSEN